jgi:mycothiol synthase
VTELPPDYDARAPREEDSERVADMLAATQRADFGVEEATAQEVAKDWHVLHLEQDAVLVSGPEGAVAAYGYFFRRGDRQSIIDGYVHPGHEGRGLGGWLLQEFERRARVRTPEGPLRLGIGIAGGNERAQTLVQRFGFRPIRRFWRMEIGLGDPAAPSWPGGVARASVEAVGDRAVWETVEESFRDHWEYQPEPYEDWRRRTVEHEAFEPVLWIVAREGADVAGAAICRRYPAFGRIETLAVRRAWRRRGLGRALLDASFRAFADAGELRVVLSVDSENLTGATHLYQQAGMRVTREVHAYEKLLGRIARTR